MTVKTEMLKLNNHTFFILIVTVLTVERRGIGVKVHSLLPLSPHTILHPLTTSSLLLLVSIDSWLPKEDRDTNRGDTDRGKSACDSVFVP